MRPSVYAHPLLRWEACLDAVGGAIALRGASPGATIASSFFINNWAHTYFGGEWQAGPLESSFTYRYDGSGNVFSKEASGYLHDDLDG